MTTSAYVIPSEPEASRGICSPNSRQKPAEQMEMILLKYRHRGAKICA
ncbi:MAG: hypothetical protein N2248_05605 [candidate division WOR-3 bacterium]|nr:hypothetical protein [candidate division WOR-3 bacterium]